MLQEAKTKREIMASFRGFSLIDVLEMEEDCREMIKDLKLKLKIKNVKDSGIDLVICKDKKELGTIVLYDKESNGGYCYAHSYHSFTQDIIEILEYEGLIDYIGIQKEFLEDDFWGDIEVRNTRIYDYDFDWDIEDSYMETFWDDIDYLTNHFIDDEHVLCEVKRWAVEQGFGDILSKYEIVSYKKKRWSLVRVFWNYYTYKLNITEDDITEDYPALAKIMDYLYECGGSIFEMAYENYLYRKEEELA